MRYRYRTSRAPRVSLSRRKPLHWGKSAAVVFVTTSVLLLSACAQWTHLTRNKPLGAGGAILIDAKQRAIISTQVPPGEQANDPWLRVCTEPSPDALSALAASAGLNLSRKDSVELAQSLTLGEGASSIGLRTQSIQLMRDAMYRLCEGYLSGALSGAGFETLHRRLQSSMVAILAIEQLTGAVRAPAVTLSGSAVTGAAELVAKYTEQTELARAEVAKAVKAVEEQEKVATTKSDELKKLEEEKATKDKKLAELKKDAAGNKDEIAKLEKELEALGPKIETAGAAKKEADTALAAAKKNQTGREEQLEASDQARKAAIAGSGKAGVQVSVSRDGCCSQPSAEAVTAISNTVGWIVTDMLSLPFTPELCTSVLLNAWSSDESVVQACMEYLKTQVLIAADRQKIAAGIAELLQQQQPQVDALSQANESLRLLGEKESGQLEFKFPKTSPPQ